MLSIQFFYAYKVLLFICCFTFAINGISQNNRTETEVCYRIITYELIGPVFDLDKSILREEAIVNLKILLDSCQKENLEYVEIVVNENHNREMYSIDLPMRRVLSLKKQLLQLTAQGTDLIDVSIETEVNYYSSRRNRANQDLKNATDIYYIRFAYSS